MGAVHAAGEPEYRRTQGLLRCMGLSRKGENQTSGFSTAQRGGGDQRAAQGLHDGSGDIVIRLIVDIRRHRSRWVDDLQVAAHQGAWCMEVLLQGDVSIPIGEEWYAGKECHSPLSLTVFRTEAPIAIQPENE